MVQCFLSDRILSGGEILRGAVRAEDGVIRGIFPEPFPADEVLDLGSLFLAPGLVDLHTHGGGGHSFAEDRLGKTNKKTKQKKER